MSLNLASIFYSTTVITMHQEGNDREQCTSIVEQAVNMMTRVLHGDRTMVLIQRILIKKYTV
jgi:hypothetical protein